MKPNEPSGLEQIDFAISRLLRFWKFGRDIEGLEEFKRILALLQSTLDVIMHNPSRTKTSTINRLLSLLQALQLYVSSKDKMAITDFMEFKLQPFIRIWRMENPTPPQFGAKKLKHTFESNLSQLPDPLRRRILAIDKQQLWSRIRISYTPEGHPVCSYHDGRSVFQITGGEPLQQADEWCEQIRVGDISALYLYGCGFGYPLFGLAEQIRQQQAITTVLVFEQDLFLFAAMLHYFDIRLLLRKFRFFAGTIEEITNEFTQLLSTDETFLDILSPTAVFSHGAKRLCRESYLTLHRTIVRKLQNSIFSIGNSFSDTLSGFHNMISNVGAVLENPYLSCIKNQFDGIPAYIVGNGPSLDKNILELKKAKGKGLVFCCESAIKPLLKNGIMPDVICVIERTPESFHYHFENIRYAEETALLALNVADPKIFTAFAGAKIPVFRGSELISEWMNHFIGDGSSLSDLSNVSHLAFAAAALAGANPIVLVGLDFAFGRDQNTHSRDSIYSEADLQETVQKIKSRPVVYTESYRDDGSRIPSTAFWLEFKYGLERLIRKNPGIKVINATEGGAKIIGTTCAPLADVIASNQHPKLHKGIHSVILDSNNEINKAEREAKKAGFIKELETYAGNYQALCQIADQGIARCKEVMELAEADDLTPVQEEISQGYESIFELYDQFLYSRKYQMTFFQQIVIARHFRINQSATVNSPEKIREVLRINLDFFEQLAIICRSLERSFQIAIERISAQN